MPKPQSDLAHESLKDPYRFDFLNLTDEAQERDIEHALVKHVTKFLLENDGESACLEVHLTVLINRAVQKPTMHAINHRTTCDD